MRIGAVVGILICELLAAGTVRAQITIRGVITDPLKRGIEGANVTVRDSNAFIVAFTSSAHDGTYKLILDQSNLARSLEIRVSVLGFAPRAEDFRTDRFVYDFVLSQTVSDLPEVKVTQPVIRSRGDTLSYRASEFARVQDRSIEDVIKRIPGVEVDRNGKIFFNGRAISKFYIDGDDVLDDKYSLGTTTIPSHVVDLVQVMENHQPIKVLAQAMPSNNVAMNITLKSESSLDLLGHADLGVGLPHQYDAELTALLLKKKTKSINVVTGNNVGEDLSKKVVSHAIGEAVNRSGKIAIQPVLSVGNSINRDIDEKRYLFNNSLLINSNNLHHVNTYTQFKWKFYGLPQRQRAAYWRAATIYLPADTIGYREEQTFRQNSQNAYGSAEYLTNKESYYLSVSAVVDRGGSKQDADLNADPRLLNQVVRRRPLDIHSQIYGVRKVSFGILEAYSYTGYDGLREALTIAPGDIPYLFAGPGPISAARQNLLIRNWYTTNYVSFNVSTARFKQTYTAGFSFSDSKLQSSMNGLSSKADPVYVPDNSVNNLQGYLLRGSIKPKYEYVTHDFRVSVQLPLEIFKSRYADRRLGQDMSSAPVFINPEVYVKYQPVKENFLTLSYQRDNHQNSISELYSGRILRSYRSLTSNRHPILNSRLETGGLNFYYRKIAKLFFINAGIGFMNQVRNTADEVFITPDIEVTRSVYYPGLSFTTFQKRAGISKYFFDLRSSVSATILLANTNSKSFLNNQVTRISNKQTSVRGSVDWKASDRVSGNYMLNYTRFSAQFGDRGAERLYSGANLSHQFESVISPGKNFLVKFGGTVYRNGSADGSVSTFHFLDLAMEQKLLRSRIDFRFEIANLADLRAIRLSQPSQSTFLATAYPVRGRMVMLHAIFNL